MPVNNLWIYGGLLVAMSPYLRQCFYAPFPMWKKDPEQMRKRTAIVTGATGNLGQSIVLQLVKNKLRVIMACRDVEQCKMIRREIVLNTGHGAIACRHLDLEDIDSINKFADDVIASEPHIDILINNAGVKHVKERTLTKYGIEKNFFVNFIAPYYLTFRLMDKLKESASHTFDSRIINITGSPKRSWDVDLDDINFERRKYHPKKAYYQSKLALSYFTILLDKFCREDKNCVYVFGASPGTEHISKSLHQPINAWEEVSELVINYWNAKPSWVTKAVVRCATDPGMTDDHSGRLYSYLSVSVWGWGKAAKDEIKAKLVWNYAARALLNITKEQSPKSQVKEGT